MVVLVRPCPGCGRPAVRVLPTAVCRLLQVAGWLSVLARSDAARTRRSWCCVTRTHCCAVRPAARGFHGQIPRCCRRRHWRPPASGANRIVTPVGALACTHNIPACAASAISRPPPMKIQNGYRVSSSEQRWQQKVTGLGWRCGVPESVCVAHGACCAPIVLLWSGSSNLAGFSAVTGRRVRRSVPAAGRRGRSGGRTPRSCGQALRAARWCLRLA